MDFVYIPSRKPKSLSVEEIISYGCETKGGINQQPLSMSGKLHQYLHLVELVLEMVLLILESTLIYALYLPLKA